MTDINAYILAFIGGCTIGVASLLMLLFNGRILGVSGIVGGIFHLGGPPKTWRFLFLAGLFVGGLLLALVSPAAFAFDLNRSMYALVAAGLLVGFGTRLGSGCTSGHGICGVSRMSSRSIMATFTFMAVGAAVVFCINHLLGGQI